MSSELVGHLPGWKAQARPPSLFRRFDFTSYELTRAFLERLADHSEQTGLYPDLGFGPRYVNVTIHATAGGSLDAAQNAFALAATQLAAELVAPA